MRWWFLVERDIKIELRNISKLEYQIFEEFEELEYLNSLKTSIKSFDYSSDKVKSSPKNHDFADIIIKISDLEREVCKNLNVLIAKRQKACDMFESLPTELCDIMKLKYLYNYSFEEISKRLSYSLRHVYRLHGQALQILRKEPGC